MNITEITVTAGRTFNDPYESYANFKPSVSLRATLAPEDEPGAAVKALQAQAEAMMEDHKRNLLKSLEEIRELTETQREMVSAEQTIRKAQQRLEEIRAKHPNLAEAPQLSLES